MLANVAENLPSSLTDYAGISLRGEAVLGFLNNLLTCDVERLSEKEVAYGALLTPQGKILHDVFVEARAQGTDVFCAADQRDALIAKLKLYRLRAKIEIAAFDRRANFIDPRHENLNTENRYDLGIANSAEIGSGKFFPHEANLDLLGGISFEKGCYVGQEVVSRMKHRGLVRSRIMPISFENGQFTDEIRNGDHLIGEVLGRRGPKALALMRLDRLQEYGLPGGVTLNQPKWMAL